jgi:hypothetical protein
MPVLSKITLTAAAVLSIASVTTTAPVHRSRASIQDDHIASPCTDNAEYGHPANGLACTFVAANETQGTCLKVEKTGVGVPTATVVVEEKKEKQEEGGEETEDLNPLFSKPKNCRRLHEPCYWHEDCCEGMECAEVNMIGLPGLCKKWRAPRPKPKMEEGEVDTTAFE